MKDAAKGRATSGYPEYVGAVSFVGGRMLAMPYSVSSTIGSVVDRLMARWPAISYHTSP